MSALSIIQRLGSTQNKCLQAIVSAYKATPTQELEIKTFTSLINLYLQEYTSAFYLRVSSSLYEQAREKFCLWIHQKIQCCCCWPALRASPLAPAPALLIINVWTTYWHHFWDHIKKVCFELTTSMSNKDILWLHKNLYKVKLSALVQFCTGCTGLN